MVVSLVVGLFMAVRESISLVVPRGWVCDISPQMGTFWNASVRRGAAGLVVGLFVGLVAVTAATASAAPDGGSAAAPAASRPADAVSVSVSVTLDEPARRWRGRTRPSRWRLPALAKVVPGFDLKKVLVARRRGEPPCSPSWSTTTATSLPTRSSSRPISRARETKTFELRLRAARVAGPARDFKVYGRFVRERHDDFAWENDRVAHRDLRTGSRDLREGSAHLERHRRLGQARAEAGRQRVVHDRRLPPGPRRGRRLLFGRQVPRLRRRRDLDGRRSSSLAELHELARARQRPYPPGLRAHLRALGRRRRAASPRRSG